VESGRQGNERRGGRRGKRTVEVVTGKGGRGKEEGVKGGDEADVGVMVKEVEGR
jgi:hypothetical protein